MLGLGLAEIVCIFLLILILFGPKDLPVLARVVVRLINDIKNIVSRLDKPWQEDSKKSDPALANSNNSHSNIKNGK